MAVREKKPEQAGARRPGGRFKLGRRWRKSALVAHIVFAGTWIGIDVMVAVLVLTGKFGTSDEVRGLAYETLATFVVWPMLVSGLLTLLTGLILGLGTKWGLVRYWWVGIKLVLNLVLCTLILVALRPGMGEIGDYGRDLAGGAPEPAGVSNLFFPPAVSLTALTLATVLAVAKPWGRIRRSGR
ncbi:hypothetical protein [Actinomadura sp. 3N508]|uniref:hypothetical protein n=1 Tax=Actinomadura sp. 3N508 TaxID=3375153 RepID=UPI003787341C